MANLCERDLALLSALMYYIPQIRQVVRTHSCKDLNLKTYAAILSGIICMEAYAINLVLNGSGLMFLITNSLSLLMTLSLCIAIFFVSKARSKRSKESQEDDCFFDSDGFPVFESHFSTEKKEPYYYQYTRHDINGLIEAAYRDGVENRGK